MPVIALVPRCCPATAGIADLAAFVTLASPYQVSMQMRKSVQAPGANISSSFGNEFAILHVCCHIGRNPFPAR